MFTWICPKCGKEVPPSYSDCPNCAGAGVEAQQEATAAPAETAAPPARAAAPASPPQSGKSRGRHYLEGAIAAVTIIVIVLTVAAIVRSGWFRGESAAPAPEAAKAEPAPFVAPPAETNPLFRNIEITGFRLTEDKQRKPQLQFVVVNHSAADLGEVKATANLRVQTAKPEEAPIATFPLTVALGPYDAKDMRVPLQTKLRAYELPDWQLLRVELVP